MFSYFIFIRNNQIYNFNHIHFIALKILVSIKGAFIKSVFKYLKNGRLNKLTICAFNLKQ